MFFLELPLHRNPSAQPPFAFVMQHPVTAGSHPGSDLAGSSAAAGAALLSPPPPPQPSRTSSPEKPKRKSKRRVIDSIGSVEREREPRVINTNRRLKFRLSCITLRLEIAVETTFITFGRKFVRATLIYPMSLHCFSSQWQSHAH